MIHDEWQLSLSWRQPPQELFDGEGIEQQLITEVAADNDAGARRVQFEAGNRLVDRQRSAEHEGGVEHPKFHMCRSEVFRYDNLSRAAQSLLRVS